VAVAGYLQAVAIVFQFHALACMGVVEVERLGQAAESLDGQRHLVVGLVIDTEADVSDGLHGVHLRRLAAGYGVDHRCVQLGVEEYDRVLVGLIAVVGLVVGQQAGLALHVAALGGQGDDRVGGGGGFGGRLGRGCSGCRHHGGGR